MNLPPLGNPLTRMQTWVRENRAQAEIVAVMGAAIGLIVVMMIVTAAVLVWKLR